MSESNETLVAVEIGPRGNLSVRLERPPYEPRQTRSSGVKLADLPLLGGRKALEDHGQALLRSIRKHKGIKTRLDEVLRGPADRVYPLYFKLEGAGLGDLYWETLCASEGFLALDRRWPIARHVDSMLKKPVRTYAPPMRMLAFLSALDQPAEREWQGLIAAVREARAMGLKIDFEVVVGEEALLTKLEHERNDRGDFTVSSVGSPWEITAKISEKKPQILHFFCHGREQHGIPALELATIRDRAEREVYSVVTLNDLKTLDALSDVWLATLNCCESARSSQGMYSFAEGLVQEGVPASVGWHEVVEKSHAHEFSRTFYADLLRALVEKLRQVEAGEYMTIEWATHLHAPRRALHTDDPAANRAWALPVLYARSGDPLTIILYRPGGGDSDQQMTRQINGLNAYERFIDSLPTAAPASFLRLVQSLRDDASHSLGVAARE